MKNVKLHMIFQWVFFMPIILPLCIVYGALRGAVQMGERVVNQMLADITAPTEERTQHSFENQTY
ncbi:hypothetical protein [Spirosoma rhododendri]|uniref:Uncharacterized protein n=1 Tax=Spirosoma rhododendri TaxID=2728024 RepID=A0A7L5DFQ6_9BACT|nr:hypothetical protein [Spirosoma rhododendri]QJD76969.1 hypothetical protein HH216_08980 [Spirosoma rhododendri]